MRIVSLIPSGTEIVALLDAQAMLVGRSHHCDFPHSITKLPAVSSTTIQYAHGQDDVQQINQQVIELGKAGDSLQRIDTAVLSGLDADLVIVDAHVAAQFDSMPDRPELLVLSPETIEDILDDIYRVGRAIGCQDRAMHEVVSLRQRMDRAEEHINPYDDGPVCGFMGWTDPIHIAGDWIVQLIGRAGARHPLNELVARPGSGAAVGPQQAQRVAAPSIAVAAELFCASNPQHLVIAPCGLNLEQALAATDRLYADAPWFAELPAVRSNRVAVVDGNAMFNRPSPRVADALEFMVGWLNACQHLIPESFPWKLWTPTQTG